MKESRSQRTGTSRAQGLLGTHLSHIHRPPSSYEFSLPENQEARSVSRVSMLSANSNFSGRVKDQQDKLRRAKTEVTSTRNVFSEKINLIQQLIDSNVKDLAKEHLRNLWKSIHTCIDNLIACLNDNEEILMEQHERETQLKKQTMMMFLKLEKSMNTSKTDSSATMKRGDERTFRVCDFVNEFADFNWQKANLLKIIDHKENIICRLKEKIESRNQSFRLQIVNSAYREQHLLKFAADSSGLTHVSSKTNIGMSPIHSSHGLGEGLGFNSDKYNPISVRQDTSNSSFQSLKQKLLRGAKKRNTSKDASTRSIEEIKGLVSAFGEKNFVLTHNKSISNPLSLKLSQLKTELRILSEIGTEKDEEHINTMIDEKNDEITTTTKLLEGVEKNNQSLESEMASIRIQLNSILIKHQHTLRVLNRRVRQKLEVIRGVNRESVLQIGNRGCEGKLKYPADSLNIKGDVRTIHLVQNTLATLKPLSTEAGMVIGKLPPKKLDRKPSDKSKAKNKGTIKGRSFKALKSKSSKSTIGHEITKSLCKIWDLVDCKTTIVDQISAVLSNPIGSRKHFQEKTLSNSQQFSNPTDGINVKRFSLSKEALNMSDGLVQTKTSSMLLSSDFVSALNRVIDERNIRIFNEIRHAMETLSNHVSFFRLENQLINKCQLFDLAPVINQLKSNLEQRDERLIESDKRRSELEFELNRLKSQLSTRNVEIINHAHTVRELEENNIFLQGMHETLEKENQELYSKAEQLKEEVQNLQQENKMLKGSTHDQARKKQQPHLTLYQSTYVIDMLRKVDTRNLTSNSMRAIHSAIQYLHSSANDTSTVKDDKDYLSLYKTHTGSSCNPDDKYFSMPMSQAFGANPKSLSPKRASGISEPIVFDPYLKNVMPVTPKKPPAPIIKNHPENPIQKYQKQSNNLSRHQRVQKLIDKLMHTHRFLFNSNLLSQPTFKISCLEEKVKRLQTLFVSSIPQLKKTKEGNFCSQPVHKQSYGSLPREGRNADSQSRFSDGRARHSFKQFSIEETDKDQGEQIMRLESMFDRTKKAVELFHHPSIKIQEISMTNIDKYLKLFAEEFDRIQLDFNLQKDLTDKLQRIVKEQQEMLKAKSKQISSLETEYLKQLQAGTQSMKASCAEKMDLNRQIQSLRSEISDLTFQNNYLKNLIDEYEKQLGLIQASGNLALNEISSFQEQDEINRFSFSKIEHPHRTKNKSTIYQTVDHATNISTTPAEMLYHLSAEQPQKSPKTRMFDIKVIQMNPTKKEAEKNLSKPASQEHDPDDSRNSQSHPPVPTTSIYPPRKSQNIYNDNQSHLLGNPYMRNDARVLRPQTHSQEKAPEENLEEIFLKKLITEYLPESGHDINSFSEDFKPHRS